jgi:transcription antitermination factor NusG
MAAENSQDDFKWYVVRAISGQEKKVKAMIESELAHEKLTKYVPEILIPTQKVYEIKNGKKTSREKSYFQVISSSTLTLLGRLFQPSEQ